MKQVFTLFPLVSAGFLALAITLAMTVLACHKNSNSDDSSGELYGRYRGTFSRTGLSAVDVSIHFKDDRSFEGTGGPLNYPSICGGNFQLTSNNLVVDDTCTWTANFDWTLIFDGNYTISFTGENSVRIWRTNGTVTDEYLLTRITR